MCRSVVVLVALIAVALPASAQCIDVDGDGYGNPGDPSCPAGPATDCNDAAAMTYPGAPEACDGFDNDCDDQVDQAVPCEPLCSSPIQLVESAPIGPEPGWRESPSVAWSGQFYGVAWTDGRHGTGEIYFQRLDPLGFPVGPESRVTDAIGVSYVPSLIFNGSEFGLAWTDERDGNGEVYFVRLDLTGSKIGNEIRITNDTAQSYGPSLAWNGRQYAVAWTHGSYAILFQRLTRSGQPSESAIQLNSTNQGLSVSLAATRTGYGATWSDHRDGNDEIYFQRIASDGSLLGSNVRVTSAPGSSHLPSLAWTGCEYGVAWSDWRYGDSDTFFARLDESGDTIGSELRVTFSPSGQYRQAPWLVWNGREYGVVAFASDRHIYMNRISPTGQLVGGELDLGPGFDKPSAAWSGAEYGVAFRKVNTDIVFTRVGCDCAPDADGDNFRICQGDCNDADDRVWPGAPEVCDSQDNDCDGAVDEDMIGEDVDSDGIHGACDNCPLLYNADQRNEDGDALGNACDNCTFISNDDQQDTDNDARGDACDNCRWSYNPLQDDLDRDQVGDACDNCVSTRNESQHDLNADGEGDECDYDDRVVLFRPIGRPRVRWQSDPSYSTYNLYRGSLAFLRATGEFTQEPGSNQYAGRFCELTVTYQDDSLVPATGEAYYWLVTGVGTGGEEPLGDGAGVDRPNTNPCP